MLFIIALTSAMGRYGRMERKARERGTTRREKEGEVWCGMAGAPSQVASGYSSGLAVGKEGDHSCLV